MKLPAKRANHYVLRKAPRKKYPRKVTGLPRCTRKHGRLKKRQFILGVVARLGMSHKLHQLEELEMQKHGMTRYRALVRAYREVSRLCSWLPDMPVDDFTHWLPNL